jgi:uncharacterized protein YhbP (UPF0306 family)
MNEAIRAFIQKQTCATVCCVDENSKPYCFSCFYEFNAEYGLLYFKSSAETHHSSLLKRNVFIAGSILPDKLNKLIVKGIQFEGVMLDANHPLMKKASEHYHKKYLIALAIPGDIYVIQINHIKMTDSTMGFGKKISWSRAEY